jgi:hypothetical protein
MQVVVGVFDTQSQAEGALVRLREMGYSDSQIALVANIRPGDQPATQPAAQEVVTGSERVAAEATGEVRPDGDNTRTVLPSASTGSAAAGAAIDADSALASRPAAGTAEAEDTATADPPQLPTTSHETERAVDDAAVGAAIGVIAGGAVGGPLGLVIGGIAGGGIGAWLASLRPSSGKMPTYADELGLGRYLLAVEVDGPTAEAHNVLRDAGAARVEIEPM